MAAGEEDHAVPRSPLLRPTNSPVVRSIATASWMRKESPEHPVLSLGICCMESKATSAPMQAILRRLEKCGDFALHIFDEEVILNEPIESWPVVDCLIAFESKGFPLEKCAAYVKLRNPRCINNVDVQHKFRSRRAVYNTLTEWCIPCPDHVIVDFATIKPNGPNVFEEHDNYIMYNNKKICKPFVEKPEDGNRHDIWIYYPKSIGGGAKKLFRKVKDKSSEFDPNQNQIRRDGVYIYEPFLPTQGTDIKVYTVGAGYVHAEARKAPTVDGKVQRSKAGKEIRYPVVLTQGEKAIAAFIVKAFRQNICGFDILRTDGGSYVCDVNGWSFVKGNQKYYNDCSTLIRKHLLEECGVVPMNAGLQMILGPDDEDVRETGTELSEGDYAIRERQTDSCSERLRSVIVVMRHGDRRPKEKMKFKTKQQAFLSYFDGMDEGTTEVKLKTTEELVMLKQRLSSAVVELQNQLEILMESTDEPSSPGRVFKVSTVKQDLLNLELLIPVLEMEDRFAGLERKVQLKASKWKQGADDSRRQVVQVQVVAKWGGELTVSGLAQAENLGHLLRHDLYPNDPTGLLRLHSSFRHDFKIYSSQEGRCQITAAAFTKGFLELEGDIIPILVSLVTRDSYAQRLLDEPIPKKVRDAVKQSIEALLMSWEDISSSSVISRSCPTPHKGLLEAAKRIGSPLQLLHTIKYLATEYIESISAAKDAAYEQMRSHMNVAAQDPQGDAHDDAVALSDLSRTGVPDPMIPFDLKDSINRRWLHLRRKEHRWRKLLNGFVKMIDEEKGFDDDTNITFDTSKIPDVWDNLYYDMLTHRHYLGKESCSIAEEMAGLIHPLNEWVCLSEYGISEAEKLKIGVDVTWRLIGKMLGDLEFMIADDAGRIDEAGKFLGETANLAASRGALIPRSLSNISGVPQPATQPVHRVYSEIGSGAGIARVLSNLSGAGSNGEPSIEKVPLKAHAGPSSSVSDKTRFEAVDEKGETGKPLVFDPPQRFSVSSKDTGEIPRRPSFLTSTDPVNKASAASASSAGAGKRQWREWATNSSVASDREGKVENQLDSPPPMDLASPVEDPESPPEVSSTPSGSDKKQLGKMTSEVRQHLSRAMRDSSDWHPRLNDEVAKITDLKNTKIVRSRIYVTSASTMHSLFNILRHGHAAGGESLVSDLGHVIDLNYLTHIVFRCYERDTDLSPVRGDVRSQDKSRYRVEISISPGVQVFDRDGEQVAWPRGDQIREENCQVAPLQIIADTLELSDLEKFLSQVVQDFGGANDDTETQDDDEKGSDAN